MRHGWPVASRHPLLCRPAWAVTAVSVPAIAVMALTPTVHGAVRLAARLAAAAATLSRQAPSVPQTPIDAQRFHGTPAVGALFELSSGRLGKHFCTASVVDSAVKDLVITAAHCVSRLRPQHVAFVPGFRNGKEPFGVWTVTQIIVDSRWRRSANPDHDVAFLVVQQAGATKEVEDLTGGERLGTGWPARLRVRVIGYPDRSASPIICQRHVRPFGHHQLTFVCGGYTDGTSGGPFVARTSTATGEGVVIGVIGGYEEGGDIASVSYSPRFGHAVRLLYETAVRKG